MNMPVRTDTRVEIEAEIRQRDEQRDRLRQKAFLGMVCTTCDEESTCDHDFALTVSCVRWHPIGTILVDDEKTD